MVTKVDLNCYYEGRTMLIMKEELCSTGCEEMLMHEDETLFKY